MAEIKFSALPLATPLVGDEVLVGLKPSGSGSDEENVIITVDDLATHILAQDSNSGGGNAFGTIVVSGQSNVVADTSSDTLTLVQGTGITITTNAGTDTVTIAASGSGGTELKGLTFTSDTGSTADSDPGNGLFKWNNATQGSATKLFFDDLSLDGISLATFFTGLPATGYIYIQQGDDSTIWQLWKWTSVTNDTGYRDFAVTLQAKSAADIADNKTVYCDFKPDSASGGSAGALVLLESHTASASASLDFTTRNAAGQSGALFQSDYDEYIFKYSNILPASGSVFFYMRMSTDGGATFDAGSNYTGGQWGWRSGGSGLGGGGGSQSQISMNLSGAGGLSTTSTGGLTGHAELFSPLSTSVHKQVNGRTVFLDTAGPNWLATDFFGVYNSTTAVNAIRFLMSSGNIASGTIRVYGIAK